MLYFCYLAKSHYCLRKECDLEDLLVAWSHILMYIHIRYFASIRELLGKGDEELSLEEGTTVAQVRTILREREPRLQPILESSICAVNHSYVPAETILQTGDELVFIPPMGGGQPEKQAEKSSMEPFIQLTREPLNREALVQAVSDPGVGGIVVFEGVVRDNARGKQVNYLEYEVYPEMAEKQIRGIIEEAHKRWGVEHVAVAHRFGRLEIGEASVIIVVATPHRGEAFEACRYIIDTLKTTVPIWKKEVATNGESWVEG
ncbi:MAG TPA: molybdopterin converting factor subunit 1 [Ktedonobacteraceae bacterium]|nr:molybdopterin converting factor subunit 1 [Ktedonobacteraceae bacterium]